MEGCAPNCSNARLKMPPSGVLPGVITEQSGRCLADPSHSTSKRRPNMKLPPFTIENFEEAVENAYGNDAQGPLT